MKKLYFLFSLLLSTSYIQAQLLSSPDLSVKDIEISLKDPDHLRGILLEHHFKYSKLEDQPCKRADSWASKEEFGLGNRYASIIGFVVYEWNENVDYPYPNAIVTISVHLTECPAMNDKLIIFEESLRTAFPIRNVRTRNDSDPFLVYTKPGTKIEVELTTLEWDFKTRIYTFTLFK